MAQLYPKNETDLLAIFVFDSPNSISESQI